MAAAAPAYLAAHGEPKHPRELLNHRCIRHRFASGVTVPWEFERDGEIVKLAPSGPLIASNLEMEISVAVQGLGLIHTFEEPLAPALAAGALVPVLKDWSQSFPGPFLFYASRRHMPAPLRAFVDFLEQDAKTPYWVMIARQAAGMMRGGRGSGLALGGAK